MSNEGGCLTLKLWLNSYLNHGWITDDSKIILTLGKMTRELTYEQINSEDWNYLLEYSVKKSGFKKEDGKFSYSFWLE